MTEPRQLGTATEYLHTIEIARRRMAELRITFDDLDSRSGMTKGYSAKVLGERAALPYHQHRFKLNQASFGPIMGALGIVWIAVEDSEAIARFKRRSDYREKTLDSKGLRLLLTNPDITSIFAALGSLGGKQRNRSTTVAKKREVSRLGGLACWRKRKWWVPR